MDAKLRAFRQQAREENRGRTGLARRFSPATSGRSSVSEAKEARSTLPSFLLSSPRRL